MIRLDTNVLVRYYIYDEADAKAKKQREAACRPIESGKPLMVCKTVLLELEWVMRGCYRFTAAQIAGLMYHLLALPQVAVEDRASVVQALSHCEAGLELADALHHASYRACDSMASFDDKHNRPAHPAHGTGAQGGGARIVQFPCVPVGSQLPAQALRCTGIVRTTRFYVAHSRRRCG